MDKKTCIKHLLSVIGMPKAQQSDLCALVLLAMADIKENDSLASASNDWYRIHDIIEYVNSNYGMDYAENSRETFRKQAIHHFCRAAITENNGTATNSPNFRYRITDEFIRVIRSIDRSDYNGSSVSENPPELTAFLNSHSSLKEIYASKKKMLKMPVKINRQDYTFSPGAHNRLQKAIIEEFAPRFAENSLCLYVGDTTKKNLVHDTEKLEELGFDISIHNKLPDVILYREDKDWLYFIEAVDSVGPMNPARINDIKKMTANVSSGKVFVSAFLTFSKYKKFSSQLAWETEVWIAEMPEHMIHLNGDKFLGPR